MRSAGIVILIASICGSAAAAKELSPEAAAATYGRIAQAMYQDSLTAAQDLQGAVRSLMAKPSSKTLSAARAAWLAARIPYQQTEGLRFGNPIVDAWEGRVNAWPLDEGLIDYVATDYGTLSDENPLYSLNIIANSAIRIGPQVLDASVIDKGFLADKLHEAQDVETNVATGYHAIEFLLWGQDLNGSGPGAGARPATDFDPSNCTGGNCRRRAQYLQAATDLLVDDLSEMAANWAPDGAARQALEKQSPRARLSVILTGLGSLSYGELAGERIKLGLILHDPEEEHDCFSDNTHNSHYFNQVGMIALVSGRYRRIDGSTVEGPGLTAYAEQRAPKAATRLQARMRATLEKMQLMKDTADSGRMAYDQMIGSDNQEGNQIVQAVIDALVAQTRAIEAVVSDLDLTIDLEGSDSLDAPGSVIAQ